MIRHFFALLRTSLTLEARIKETAMLLFALTLMLSVIAALGVQSGYFEPFVREKLFAPLVWMIFVLVATVSIGRSFEYELEHRAIDGLLLSGVSPTLFYLTKVIANSIVLIVAQVWSFICLGILLNISVSAAEWALFPLIVLVVIAYAALATLFAGVALGSKLRQMLLPVLLLPLLFPLFFCALELTNDILSPQGLQLGSPWLSLLLALNVVYVALGLNLFEYVVKE